MKKERILVAMSGGIDSSVAAMLLHEQGHEVVGITMKTWDYASSGGNKKETGCCSIDSINDARQVAVKLGFPHFVLDLREEFGDFVINHFTDEYIAGRTPNPCVLCNTHIKWDALLRRADALDCAYIATGHYAQVRYENGRYVVSKGKDTNKDQSYALWGVSQTSLSRTLLPLGQLNKPQIRAMATERGFHFLVAKSESYEICFIPDNDYRGFLKRRVPNLDKKVEGGDFILADGTIMGKHKGYPFYTIGQRKGLGITLGYPVYVTAIDAKKNQVTLGRWDELAKNGMYVHQLIMGKYVKIVNRQLETITKVRYNDVGTPATIEQTEDDKMRVYFKTGVHAIAPGQAAVFYEGDDVVGGGWIHSAFQYQ